MFKNIAEVIDIKVTIPDMNYTKNRILLLLFAFLGFSVTGANLDLLSELIGMMRSL
jgi:hypothetical protein